MSLEACEVQHKTICETKEKWRQEGNGNAAAGKHQQ